MKGGRLIKKRSTSYKQQTSRGVRVTHKSAPRKSPVFLTILSVFLALFGLLMIFNVSSISALTDFNDQYYYVKEQSQWLGLGVAAMVCFSLFSYKRLYKMSLTFLGGSILLLLAVFVQGFGVRAMGASRWLDLGFITLQPSELVKLSLIIYLAAWLSHEKKVKFSSFLILLAVTVGPIILQPDLGSAVIITGIATAMYFLSGAPLWQFGGLIAMLVSSVSLLAISAPYRLERVKTFINPDLDPQGASYHVRQILIAIGTGGWFGVGVGKSRQKFAYLPEVTTDSIFAVMAEEIGFIGSTVVLVLFILLVMEGIKITRDAKDAFGKLLAAGITLSLATQMIVNLGAMVSLLPLTGVPLPFLSYGGSSLIISFSMVGILINISRSKSS